MDTLKISKIKKAIEDTRGNGNTMFLTHAVQFSVADMVVMSETEKRFYNKHGFQNLVRLDEIATDRPFVLDNGVVFEAINEALELIERLRGDA
jgi:hypothetical protein